jgi:hypothetical protein
MEPWPVERGRMPPLVIHLVHGTWARGPTYHVLQACGAAFPPLGRVLPRRRAGTWLDEESAILEALKAPNRTFSTFEWSASNSIAARRQAAVDLADYLGTEVARAPDSAHVMIAHSHGGNASLQALGTYCDADTRGAVKLLITMATPFLIAKGSAYPRIRRALVFGRLSALLAWILFPVLFWATGFLSESVRGMITPAMGVVLLWSSALLLFFAASFLLTSEQPVLRGLGAAVAAAWTWTIGIAPRQTIAAAAGDVGLEQLVPHLDLFPLLVCLNVFVVAWRSSVRGAEALRDLVRVALLIAVPIALLAFRFLLDDPLQTLMWDASAITILPSFVAGTALSCVGVLLWRPRPGSPEEPPVQVRLLAVRLGRDEASFAINAARILEGAGAFLYRWRWSAIPLAILTTLLSPLLFLQGVGLVASAAYGGWPALLNIAGQFGSLPPDAQALLAALGLGAIMPVVSLVAAMPLCLAVGPEVLFGLSTTEVVCDELPAGRTSEMTLEVLPLSEATAVRGMHHSAYNYPGIQRRIAAELSRLEAEHTSRHSAQCD